MEEKMDKIIGTCGNEDRCQYVFIVVTFLYWIGINYFHCLLPYLEWMPKVRNTDKKGNIEEEVLNYDICEN